MRAARGLWGSPTFTHTPLTAGRGMWGCACPKKPCQPLLSIWAISFPVAPKPHVGSSGTAVVTPSGYGTAGARQLAGGHEGDTGGHGPRAAVGNVPMALPTAPAAAPDVWRRLGSVFPNGSHEVTVLIKVRPWG